MYYLASAVQIIMVHKFVQPDLKEDINIGFLGKLMGSREKNYLLLRWLSENGRLDRFDCTCSCGHQIPEGIFCGCFLL